MTEHAGFSGQWSKQRSCSHVVGMMQTVSVFFSHVKCVASISLMQHFAAPPTRLEHRAPPHLPLPLPAYASRPPPCSPAQPSKMLNKTTLTRDFRRVAKSIVKNTQTNYYRPDLTKMVLAKWSLISKSQKKAKK